MSNRQARREQARTTRTPRTTRPSGGPAKRPSNTGGGSDIFSRGFLLAMGAFAVVAVAVIALVVAFGGGDDEDSDLAAALEKASADLPLDLINGTKIGKDDAPVKIVSYEDFQCPFCLRWTLNYEPLVVNEYVLEGKVRLEFRNLPILGDESILAARGAHCAAEQDLFWPYHKELFLRQYESGQLEMEQLNIGLFAADQLTAMAVQAGLDDTTFAACLDDPGSLAAVGTDVQEAARLGFRGTPSFVIGDTAIGSQIPADADGWRALLDTALAR